MINILWKNNAAKKATSFWIAFLALWFGPVAIFGWDWMVIAFIITMVVILLFFGWTIVYEYFESKEND